MTNRPFVTAFLMKRPWQIWLSFTTALALVAAAVGWLSLRALESDKAEAAGREQALIEENVRLALWRMDSLMAAFVAQESARPAAAYRAVAPPGIDNLGFAMHARTDDSPSPLLVQPPVEAFLYFQRSADGAWSSPQVPAESVPADAASAERIALAKQRLSRLEELWNNDPALAARLATDNGLEEVPPQFRDNPNGPAVQIGQRELAREGAEEMQVPQQELSQAARGTNEFRRRSNYVMQNNTAAQTANSEAYLAAPVEAPATSTMVPRIAAGELFLVRTVTSSDRTTIQGCWIDWDKLRGELLTEIADLLPTAALQLADVPRDGEQTRMLAALPVSLDPGLVAVPAGTGLSGVKLALVVAWTAMVLAAVAVAVLLRGVVALSERRADFVSAVTHELRTPLTTFRMYAEMLAEGMVPDESSRRRYLETLALEADRLTHLVENVLAYARLERGGMGNRIQPLEVDELLARATGRLGQRAREAGFEVVLRADEAVREARVLCDPSAVEQILFNLVDNACKYAAGAGDKTLAVEARAGSGKLNLSVVDRGPGIPASERRRLFQPFRKSAEAAARSAPGVGLGLALSRRLARDMGGDLEYQGALPCGAAFVLTLPLAPDLGPARIP